MGVRHPPPHLLVLRSLKPERLSVPVLAPLVTWLSRKAPPVIVKGPDVLPIATAATISIGAGGGE